MLLNYGSGEDSCLEKEMATHPSILAWRIPWTEEPGGLQSMRSQRVRHDWAIKQKSLENPLDSKEIRPVNPKWNPPWIFTGRTDIEVETPVLWSPDENSWLIDKDPDAGKDWGQEEKGTTEDEMVGWHHQLSGHESKQTSGDGEGQGRLACCSPWGC